MSKRNNRVKTSVIVPVYNTEKYIRDCLDSLLQQTHKEMQVIVVDDGSTDRSMEIVNEYCSYFENMLIISQKNQGLGAARNVGIRASEGQFIYLLDSDDFIEKDTLESCYRCAMENDLDLVLFDAEVLLEDGIEKGVTIGKYDRRRVIREVNQKYTGRSFLENYMEHEPDIVSAALVYTRRSFMIRHNLFFCEGIFHEDEEFRFRLMMAEPMVMYLPKLFYHRRYRAGSIMASPIEDKRLQDYIFALEKMIGFADSRDRLAMTYIARKIWSAFVRFNRIFKKNDFDMGILQKKICILLQNYHDKFYKIIDSENHILFDYQVYRVMDIDEDWSEYSIVEKKRNDLLYKIFSNLPLKKKGEIIGIYGLGLHTEKLLQEYHKIIGEIYADIVFIDSNIETGTVSFMGYQVYNIADIHLLSLQEIIISSYLYEKDLVVKLHELYGNRFKLHRLYEDYSFALLNILDKSEPKVSVIIPVFNCAQYLEQCLGSVLAQTLLEIEVICIDDGSTDNSTEIIEKIAKDDTRVLLLRQDNQGSGKARNFGIQKAKGKYIAFLDADDYYVEPNALENMFHACEDSHVKVVGSLRKSLIDGVEKKEYLFKNVFQKNQRIVIIKYQDWQMDYDYQSFLFNRKLLLDNNILFPGYRRFQDPPFFVKALYVAEKFAVVKTYLYCYRFSGVSSRFDTAKTVDLLKGLIENLNFAQEHDLNILFDNTISRLEYEYAGIICRNLSSKDLNIITLLLNANQIICNKLNNSKFIIRPLRMILENAMLGSINFEDRFLMQVQEQNAISIYGAGKLANKFLKYLRSKNLIEKVSFIIVSEINSKICYIDGIPLISVKDMNSEEKKQLVLIAVGTNYYKDIIDRLEENHYTNYKILDYSFLEGF